MKRRLIVSTIIVLVMSMFISKNVYALDSTYQGYDVAGRIEIPSINLDLPILDRATSNSMKVSVGLVYGSFFALIITVILYLIRNVLSFRECMDCVPEGFKAMVPAILILTFAWSLKAMTDSLGAREFVAGLISSDNASDLMNFLPAIIFLIACFLSFATGTSWGTFGILIPIVVDAFNGEDRNLMIIAISACMAGAVCGDHCSPISDTTIMASAGAECNHVNHVSTQLPYALVAAVASALTFLAAGFIRTAWISLVIGIAIMAVCIFIIKTLSDRKKIEFPEKIPMDEN